jgi:hypothetical protein
MPESVYTVRVPDDLSHVRSADVRAMFETVKRRVLAGEEVPIASDPGAGEKFLRLTLPSLYVTVLQKSMREASASVALRRLMAMFVVPRALPIAHPVRALPAHPASERPRSEKRAESSEPLPMPPLEGSTQSDYQPFDWWRRRMARPDAPAAVPASESLAEVKWEYFLWPALVFALVVLFVLLYKKLRD